MKKISPELYADAFIAALDQKHSEHGIIERFIATIKRRNDWSKRYHIISACQKKLRHKEGRELITIESARELSPSQKEKLSAQWKSKTRDIEYSINSSLIAGAKIIVNEVQEFDGSLRRKINSLFSEK